MLAPSKILVTSFHPFRGREHNGSQTIAAALPSLLPDHNLQLLDLPVTWEAMENIAQPRIAADNPDIILGLGEGSPRFLKIETLASIFRHGIDENEQPPPTEQLTPNGSQVIQSRWPLPEELPEGTILSSDAGRYLCNAVLYRFCESPATFAGFLHLPPQRETDVNAYRDQWLPKVSELMNFAIHSLPL